MSLTNDEAQINRRVAVALGYSVQEHQRGNRSGFRVMRHEIPQGITLWARESGAWSDIPDFCRDPAAADLVREEIERRGWMLIRYDYASKRPLPAFPSQHRANITTHLYDPGYWGMSDDLPTLALCMAFLEAHEASKAQEGGEAG